MKKQYLISVIVPVYQVEEYLEETIESVINQTIGFENIQLILINDGSPDNSEEICLKYKELYPENIIYIKQENAGVSAARNNGLKHAEAPVINFLDSDDLWEPTAYEEGLEILNENKEVNSVIYPLRFFDAKTGGHPLNFMFRGEEKIIDIREDYENIKLQSCSIIFRKKALEGHEYSNKLKISEDARLLCEVLMDNPIVGKAKSYYLYRKRADGSSAIQTSTQKKTWYLDTTEHAYKYVIDLSKEKFGEVIKYIQFYILYDFKWRLNEPGDKVLSKEEQKKYIDTLRYCIENVDDETIANFRFMNSYEKQYTLNFKYQNKANYKISDGKLCIKNTPICNSNELQVFIDNIYVKNEKLEIYGRMPKIKNVCESVYLKGLENEYLFETYELDNKNRYFKKLDKKSNHEYIGIHISIDLKEEELELIAKGKKEETINYVFTYNSIFNNRFKSIYIRSKGYYIYYKNQKIYIKKKNIFRKISLETKCLYNLFKKKKYKSLIYRLASGLYRICKTKEIWIVSDRIQVAGDNGEAFYDYLSKQKDKNIKVYFAISENSADYERLKNNYKNILKYHSFKHKILHLNADKIVSAQADDYVTNPFGKGKYYLADLYRFDFVFLQHGIINNDLSPWLNINSKKIDLFVTSATPEYESITSGEYHYNFPKENIILTGLPRYDKLKNKDVKLKKQIVIMPTWRTGLVSNIDVKTGKRKYNQEFKNTEYYKFYNQLINDSTLLDTLKKHNYKIKFIPHANMMEQICDFEQNEYVEFATGVTNYSKEFKENKLLITDYSSVFFDFSHLKKPIVLAHFDREEFFKTQIYDRGYFQYEKDGFGKVTYNIEETIAEIIKVVKNDCKLEKKYENNIKKFYKYDDQKNCERVYKEIKKL